MRLLASREIATAGGKFTSWCTWFASPLNSASSQHEVRAYVPHDVLHALQVGGGEYPVPVLGDEHQVGMQDKHAMPARADVLY